MDCADEEAAVMPAGEMAAGAGGRSRFRPSDADREQAVDVLKAAFVEVGWVRTNLTCGSDGCSRPITSRSWTL